MKTCQTAETYLSQSPKEPALRMQPANTFLMMGPMAVHFCVWSLAITSCVKMRGQLSSHLKKLPALLRKSSSIPLFNSHQWIGTDLHFLCSSIQTKEWSWYIFLVQTKKVFLISLRIDSTVNLCHRRCSLLQKPWNISIHVSIYFLICIISYFFNFTPSWKVIPYCLRQFTLYNCYKILPTSLFYHLYSRNFSVYRWCTWDINIYRYFDGPWYSKSVCKRKKSLLSKAVNGHKIKRLIL